MVVGNFQQWSSRKGREFSWPASDAVRFRQVTWTGGESGELMDLRGANSTDSGSRWDWDKSRVVEEQWRRNECAEGKWKCGCEGSETRCKWFVPLLERRETSRDAPRHASKDPFPPPSPMNDGTRASKKQAHALHALASGLPSAHFG